MHSDFPAYVVIKARDFPGDDASERQIVVQDEPPVVIRPQGVRQTPLETSRVATVRRSIASRGRAVKDFRSAVRCACCIVLRPPDDAITGDRFEGDHDVGRDVSQRSRLRGEVTTGDDVPTRGEPGQIGIGGRFCGGRGLRLVRLQDVGRDRWPTHDAASDGQGRRVHQQCRVFEIAHEFHGRRSAIPGRNSFSKSWRIRGADPLDLTESFGPGLRCVLPDIAELPEIAGVDQRQDPQSFAGRDSASGNWSWSQRKQVGSNPRRPRRHCGRRRRTAGGHDGPLACGRQLKNLRLFAGTRGQNRIQIGL